MELLMEDGHVIGMKIKDNSISSDMAINHLKLFFEKVVVRLNPLLYASH